MARGKAREKAEILARQLQALDLRKRGLSYREIGTKLGVSHETARSDVEGELERLASLRDSKIEIERQLDLERLDMMIKGLEAMALVGKPDAVNALLKCLERRSKLIGLDAPIKQDINLDMSKLTDDELQRIAAGGG